MNYYNINNYFIDRKSVYANGRCDPDACNNLKLEIINFFPLNRNDPPFFIETFNTGVHNVVICHILFSYINATTDSSIINQNNSNQNKFWVLLKFKKRLF